MIDPKFILSLLKITDECVLYDPVTDEILVLNENDMHWYVHGKITIYGYAPTYLGEL